MPAALPTLGSVGWVSDMESTADYLMSCFLATNRSQSVLHREQNTSLQYLLKKNANNMVNLEIDLRNALTTKLRTTFGDSAEALVDVVPASDDTPDQYSIRFTGIVSDGSKQYTVGKLVQFQNSRILKIAAINNG